MMHVQVAVYAIGPQSHLFRGKKNMKKYEKFKNLFRGLKQQTYIPNVIAYAACIGEGKTFCKEES